MNHKISLFSFKNISELHQNTLKNLICITNGECIFRSNYSNSLYHIKNMMQGFCDGAPDCSDGSDEMEPEDCPVCPQGKPWACANGNCIEERYVCEGRNDCGDWSDEYDPRTGKCPPCPASMTQCANTGRCINANYHFCNGANDCGDWSDESEEICPCSKANQVRCPMPRDLIEPIAPMPCYSPEHVCDEDGIWDCLDGFDEANCNKDKNEMRTLKIAFD